jgi:hypothetical protein
VGIRGRSRCPYRPAQWRPQQPGRRPRLGRECSWRGIRCCPVCQKHRPLHKQTMSVRAVMPRMCLWQAKQPLAKDHAQTPRHTHCGRSVPVKAGLNVGAAVGGPAKAAATLTATQNHYCYYFSSARGIIPDLRTRLMCCAAISTTFLLRRRKRDLTKAVTHSVCFCGWV